MGTRFEFVLSGGDPHDAAAAMQELVLVLDERWSAFRKDSFLSYVNREAAREPVRLDTDTWDVLRLALRHVVARLRVYRTYVEDQAIHADDRRDIRRDERRDDRRDERGDATEPKELT